MREILDCTIIPGGSLIYFEGRAFVVADEPL